jgi:CubicO group peptidase (beta-lactamase class C family)
MPLFDKIQSILDSAVADPTTGVPGIAFVAVNKNGTVLTQNAAGKRGLSSDEPMTSDTTVLWIASCTKLITAISAMQLVEQGKLDFDDAEQVDINASFQSVHTDELCCS